MSHDTFLKFTPVPGDSSWGREWIPKDGSFKPTNVENLTQSAFIFHNFRVNASFGFGGANFSDVARDVCVLDLVLMLQAAKSTLESADLAVVDLSDRQGEWHFWRNDGDVRLRARYATREGWRYHPMDGKCSVREFDELAHQSLRDALVLIFTEQPSTRRNPYLQTLAHEAFGSGPSVERTD